MWCIHNAVVLQKRGLSTTIVCTSDFASLVRETTEAKGAPDIGILTVSHPIAENDTDKITRKADDAIDELVRVITGPGKKAPEEGTEKSGPGKESG